MRKYSVLIAISLCCLAGTASASDKKIDLGKREYLNSCAVCHGPDGKAQTQALDILKVAPLVYAAPDSAYYSIGQKVAPAFAAGRRK